MEGILCLSHVLLAALLALDQIDQVLGLASRCGSYMEGLSSGCALDGGTCLDVVAGKAASTATRAASTGWLEEGWLELGADQKVPKVLRSAIGHEGPLRDGFLQVLGGMKYWEVALSEGW